MRWIDIGIMMCGITIMLCDKGLTALMDQENEYVCFGYLLNILSTLCALAIIILSSRLF